MGQVNFSFGEWVTCLYGYEKKEYLVIGEPHYTPVHDHVVLADADVIGMPISVGHCKVFGATNVELAKALRERYLLDYPGALKEMA